LLHVACDEVLDLIVNHAPRSQHRSRTLAEAGWGVASLARAAELLKHTWPAGWRAADVEQPFIAWVNACILPALNSEALTRLPLANWHATVAGELADCSGKLGVGVCVHSVSVLRGAAAQ
jgi:hypothetical protein